MRWPSAPTRTSWPRGSSSPPTPASPRRKRMTYKCLIYESKDGLATLTLNRPERLNALGDTLRDDLHDALRRASEDTDTRAIIITGAGRGFCSGGDVKAMHEAREARRERALL